MSKKINIKILIIILSITLAITFLIVVLNYLPLYNPNTLRYLRTRKIEDKQRQKELDRKRYESWFETPYENIKNLSGGCVAWGMSGYCNYRFESFLPVELKNKKSFNPFPAEKAYKVFESSPFLTIKDKELLQNPQDLNCIEGIFEDGDGFLFIKNNVKNIYILQVSYQLRGK